MCVFLVGCYEHVNDDIFQVCYSSCGFSKHRNMGRFANTETLCSLLGTCLELCRLLGTCLELCRLLGTIVLNFVHCLEP